MIELMVTALMVALIAAGVSQALIAGAHLSAHQRHRSQAAELAQQDQERLRGLSSTQLDGLNQTVTTTLVGTKYTITSTASFLSSTGGAACGSTGPGAAAYYSSTSTVSWTDLNGSQSISEHSLITPPAGGSLLVKTVDQLGNPLAGVAVNASGPDVQAATTDSSGCVILADLAQGSYNLTLADPGYVDPDGDLSPLSATASVTATGTASPSIGNPVVLGQAATLLVGATTPTAVPGFSTPGFTTSGAPTTLTTGAADAVSWYGAGGALEMSSSDSVSAPAGSQKSTFVLGNLFPFAFTNPTSYANDYQAWTGPCRQEQPPPGTNDVAAGVTPGSTQVITVKEPAVNLSFLYNNVQTAPTAIKVTFTSSSGILCTDSLSASVASAASAAYNGWLADPGLPFASTATSGPTASESGQTGTLNICAYKTVGSTYYYGTTGPFQNTNFTGQTPETIRATSTRTTVPC